VAMKQDRRVVVHIPCHRQEVAVRLPAGRLTMDSPLWWERRAEVFERVTLPSLLNQRCRDFDVVLTVRDVDNDADNPLLRLAEEAGFEVCVRPYEQWRYPLAPNHYEWFVERYRDVCDWLMLVQLESDDAYEEGVVQLLYDMGVRDGLVFYFDVGYAYGLEDGRLCRYGIRNLPEAFFGCVYGPRALQSAEAFREYRRQWRHDFFHYNAPRAPRSRRMPEGMFLQTVHGANSTSSWRNKPTARRVIEWITDEGERRDILARFGIRE